MCLAADRRRGSNDEWLWRDFTKRALADALETILEQNGT